MRMRWICILILFGFAVLAPFSQAGERPIPDGVNLIQDVVYSTVDGKELKMDIAYPQEESDTPRPVIVWIHGGAWLAGNKDRNPAMRFTALGYLTACINYRLSQEAIWPAQIHDCKAAIRYLRAHAKKYNLDPDKIGVWGSSAGGHLVAMLGTSGGVKELEGEGGWGDQSSRVQAVVDYFGPTNFLKMCEYPSQMDHGAPDSPESLVIGGKVSEHPDRVRSIDPITYVTPDDPPFLIAHGDKDPLVPYNQSVLLYDALKKAEVDVEFITVKGGGHGGWNEKTQPTNREILDRVTVFFEEHLK